MSPPADVTTHHLPQTEDGAALTVEVHTDAEAVSHRAAAWIAEIARDAIATRDRFVLALSGGTTPRRMLRLLADQAIDWSRVHVVQVDERATPEDSDERNLGLLRESLLSRVSIPAAHIHAMPVNADDLDAAAALYGMTLTDVAGSPPVLDLVTLGLGADGHTASLVPGDAALRVMGVDVAITAPYHGRRRMTLTYPILNRARRILWLVTGDNKAGALARLVAGDASAPASHVVCASALVLADRAASAKCRWPTP